jgi:hypothetical protein
MSLQLAEYAKPICMHQQQQRQLRSTTKITEYAKPISHELITARSLTKEGKPMGAGRELMTKIIIKKETRSTRDQAWLTREDVLVHILAACFSKFTPNSTI